MRKAVVEREDNEHYIAFVDANHRMGLLYVGRVIAVGEEDAFDPVTRTLNLSVVSLGESGV